MIFVHETIYFFFEKKKKSKEILLYNLERILILHIYSSLRRIRKFSNEKFLIKNIREKIFSKRNLNIPLDISVWPSVGKKVKKHETIAKIIDLSIKKITTILRREFV